MNRKRILIYLLLFLLIGYQVGRLAVFINEYGGLEHDGGWLLGVARSVAERGEYTTLVSTIVDPAVPAGINVDGKFDIQAADGRIWFFTGNGIGPASILIDALFLKLFGVGFWQFHLGPLFFFVLYIGLASLILLRVGGVVAAAWFHLYLFLYPHLSVFLGYEAMGEVPAMAYILLAYGLFVYALRRERWPWFFLSGVAMGLAINAKLIAFLSFGGVFALWLTRLWRRRTGWVEGLITGLGVLTPLALWEAVRLVTLTRLTGFALYQRHLQERLRFILDEGSGLGAKDHSGAAFHWTKALIVSEISHPHPILSLLTLLLVAGGGLGLIWLYRREPVRQRWAILLWVGWLGNAAWFIGPAKTGWVRHAWFELILAVLILSLLGGELVRRLRQQFRRSTVAAALLVIGILLPGYLAQRQAATFFISDRLVESWRQKQVTARYTRLPWVIIPRAEQARVIDFLEGLPAGGRVFYPANHKAAEIAVQAGRIFYPLERRELMPPAEGDVVLIGATLISPWKDAGIRHSLIERAKVECPNFLYRSEYYIICTPWE